MCDVILVDDERIELEALKKLINKLGIKVNIVGELQSAKEAIAAHKDFKADVIIIDNEMPGINGTELAKIIKSNNKDKIIILLIEYYNFNNELDISNIDDYILKPVSLEKLFKVLNKHIINLATNKNKCTSLLNKMINIFIKINKNKSHSNLNIYIDKLNKINNICKINIVMNEFLDFMSKDNTDYIIREKLIGNREVNILLNPVLIYISENYSEKITLESVSKACNLSVFYLSKLFKKNTGMKFIDYINLYKIEKAKQLLENTDMCIINISMSLGYDESGYFSKVFKKVVGVTPSAYRNKNLNKPE